MLESTPVAWLVGSVLGLLSGLGVGGGSLLMLWLTLALDTPWETAKLINLLFFIPAALTASLFRLHQGKLKLLRTVPAAVAGCIGALLLAWLAQWLDTGALRKGFGILLLLTGLRELCYRPRKAK